MAVQLIVVESYVEAVRKSGLKERSLEDYYNCLHSKLHDIKGDKVLFRNYLSDAGEYMEYAFSRKKASGVEFLYTTYGIE